MQRIPTHLRMVPDDPSLELYEASRVGTELAKERSDHTGMVVMKRFDLFRIWLGQYRLRNVLGMPKFSPFEVAIVNHVLANGRPDDEGFLAWTAMRPGQRTAIASLTYETTVKRQHINTALNRLIKIGLVQRAWAHMRESVRLTEAFHRMMFEAEWRNRLRDSSPQLFDGVVAKMGWHWLIYYSDELFHLLSPRKVEDRRAALQELARRTEQS